MRWFSELIELRVRPGRWVRWGLGASGVLVLLGVWQFLTWGAEAELRIVSPVTLPSPGEVFASIGSLFSERALARSVAATLWRVLLGFGLAILVGAPLGILAGTWRGLDALLAPLSLFGRNIPIAALVPLTILWFGTENHQKVMFIFIATVPFVFGTAVQAVVEVKDRYVETALTLGASRGQVLRKVLVPLSLPAIYTGNRILFGLAFGYIMLAEAINAKYGLGHLIMTSQRRGMNEHIYVILILIGLIAYGIDRLLYYVELTLFRYREKS